MTFAVQTLIVCRRIALSGCVSDRKVSKPTLFLPRSLVLAAVLVVVTGKGGA